MQTMYGNSIDAYIQSYEFFIPPLSATSIGALTGAKIGGLYGAAIGGTIGCALGVTDKLLVHYEITSRHYLTNAILGAGMMHSFQLPYYVGEIGGFIIGGLIPTGYLNSFTPAVQPVTNAAIIAKFAGQKFPLVPYAPLYGAAAGATITLVDEALIYFNVTDKHYLSTAAVVATTFDFMAPKFNTITGWAASLNKYTLTAHTSLTNFFNSLPYASLGTGVVLGAYVANKTEANILAWKPITVGKDLIKTYERVLDKKELESTMELFAISSLTNQLLFHNIKLTDSAIHQTLSVIKASLGIEDIAAKMVILKTSYSPNLFKVGVVIFPYILSLYVDMILNNYFSEKLNDLILDAIESEWLQNNTALKLSDMESTTTLLHHMEGDIEKIANTGTSVIADAFSKAARGFIATGYIVNNEATDMLICALLYTKITLSVSQAIAKNINSYSDLRRDTVTLKDNMITGIIKKAKVITQNQAIPFYRNDLKELRSKLKIIKREQLTWEILHGTWLTLKGLVNNIIFNVAAITYKVCTGQLSFDVMGKLPSTLNDAFSLISFEMQYMSAILGIEKSNESINKLLDAMRTATTTELYDKEYKKGNLSIILEDFTVFIQKDGRVLVNPISMQLDPGIYLFLGPIGSGKSSFLKKLQGLAGNGISAKGKLTFITPDGAPPTIVAIAQDSNTPLNCSFLKLSSHPEPLPTDPEALANLSQRVRELWSRIGKMNASSTQKIESFIDDENPHNWDDLLSGGERRVVSIISALLQNPHVVILDETLSTSLDPRSTRVIKEAIKELFAERIILSIDHIAADNNCSSKFLNVLETTLASYKLSDPSEILQKFVEEVKEALQASGSYASNADKFYDHCFNLTDQTFEPCL